MPFSSNGDIAHLLRLVPADDGEFNVVPFAERRIWSISSMVARDERPHFAASHLQIFTRGVQIGLHTDNLGVHGLDVVTVALWSSSECTEVSSAVSFSLVASLSFAVLRAPS